MQEAIRHLLAAAMELSPTSTEQAAFSAIVNRTGSERRPDDVIVMDLASGILTGVSHGAWPKVDD
jgi:hypothetical protein